MASPDKTSIVSPASWEGAGWALGAQFRPGTRWYFWRPNQGQCHSLLRYSGLGVEHYPDGNVERESEGLISSLRFALGIAF